MSLGLASHTASIHRSPQPPVPIPLKSLVSSLSSSQIPPPLQGALPLPLNPLPVFHALEAKHHPSNMPTVLRSSYKNRDPREAHSRNPGRRDNFLWNSDAFICPHDVEGFRRDIRDPTAATPAYEYETDADAEDSVVPEQDSYNADAARHEVALMDIARYAKLKGVAKEYEVLDAPRRVIVLDEEAFSFLDDSDDNGDSEWEDLDAFSDAETSSTAIAGSSKTRLEYDEEDDFALAKRLQDEEYARAGVPRPMARRVVSGGERKAYADVLVESNG